MSAWFLDSELSTCCSSSWSTKIEGSNLTNLAGKTLANCNELSLSYSIKTHHLHATLKLKPQLFILLLCAALKGVCATVHAFAVSSVVRGHCECKDAWNVPCDSKREPSNPRDAQAVV